MAAVTRPKRRRAPAQQAPARRARSPRPHAGSVSLELTPAQVDHVLRSASEAGNLNLLLAGGLHEVRGQLERNPAQLADSQLSRSLLWGLLLLSVLPSDGSHVGNADLARVLGQNPSTTHRYLKTLVAVGLAERDPATRRYRLSHGARARRSRR